MKGGIALAERIPPLPFKALFKIRSMASAKIFCSPLRRLADALAIVADMPMAFGFAEIFSQN